MNIREIETLVDLAHVARVSEVTVRANGRRITIRKDPAARVAPAQAPVEIVKQPQPTASTLPPELAAPAPQEAIITSPMVGIFHSPDPHITVGSWIEAGQVVGIIESMRLMNDLRAEISGEVQSVLVEDGMAVEYGQPILRTRVAAEPDDSDFGV